MHVHHVHAILWFISISCGIIALIPSPPLLLLCQAEVAEPLAVRGLARGVGPAGRVRALPPVGQQAKLPAMALFLPCELPMQQ